MHLNDFYLRLVHHLRAHSACRLIEGLMDNEPISKVTFRPDEILLDNAEIRRLSGIFSVQVFLRIVLLPS